MNEKREREIRMAAEKFRSSCFWGNYGGIDLFQECIRQGYSLIRYPLEKNDCLGFCQKRDADIIIFTNSSVRLAREIFTLAHELGHVILHFGIGVSDKENDTPVFENDKTLSGKSENWKEEEANLFAACLLMPKEAVEKFFELELFDIQEDELSAYDVAKIMSVFQVSFETALNRLENLGKIHLKNRGRLDNEKNENRVGKLLRTVGGNGRLNMASKEVSIPPKYLDYAIYNYNHGAVPRETLERVLNCYDLTADDIGDKLLMPIEKEEELDELIGRMKV